MEIETRLWMLIYMQNAPKKGLKWWCHKHLCCWDWSTDLLKWLERIPAKLVAFDKNLPLSQTKTGPFNKATPLKGAFFKGPLSTFLALLFPYIAANTLKEWKSYDFKK